MTALIFDQIKYWDKYKCFMVVIIFVIKYLCRERYILVLVNETKYYVCMV